MFKFKAVQPARFEPKIYSVQLFPRENLKNPQMKSQGCFDTRFFACLSFSTKWVTFFSKDSSNFRQYFGGVFLKSVLFILCFLQTLETKRCWLWRAFAHVSPRLRSESFGIYIHYSVRKINSCFNFPLWINYMLGSRLTCCIWEWLFWIRTSASIFSQC